VQAKVGLQGIYHLSRHGQQLIIYTQCHVLDFDGVAQKLKLSVPLFNRYPLSGQSDAHTASSYGPFQPGFHGIGVREVDV
jgi:hypothetical protein